MSEKRNSLRRRNDPLTQSDDAFYAAFRLLCDQLNIVDKKLIKTPEIIIRKDNHDGGSYN